MKCLKILINCWYRKNLNLFFWILYPIELVYLFIIFFRKKLYEYKIFKTYKFNVPIIVIGNITVGGTGKTPLVIYIANYLKSQGFKPAIVTRGYKSKCKIVSYVVTKNSDPDVFGDEPILIANNTDSPVIIGKNRVASIQFLLKNFDINIIICDDGLQHYKLARDLEIVMIDGERFFGNGHCLPIGPLREPINKLNTVDLIVLNNNMVDARNNEQSEQLLNNNINNAILNNQKNKYISNLVPEKIYNLTNPSIVKTPADFGGMSVHAVSGIGNNQRFFNLLQALGIKIINHEFLDHHKYQEKDLCFNDGLPVIMTEKDAVKCIKFAKDNFWCLSVKVKFNLEEQFNNYLTTFLRGKS